MIDSLLIECPKLGEVNHCDVVEFIDIDLMSVVTSHSAQCFGMNVDPSN